MPPASGQTSRGVEGWYTVFDFTTNEALDDGVTVDITMKPTDVYDNGTLLQETPYEVTTP